MNLPPILTDDDVDRLLTPSTAIVAMETAFRAKAAGKLVAPPRLQMDAPGGGLVFTAGGIASEVLGFRVYPTFGPSGGAAKSNVVCVYDARSGALTGVIVGNKLGALRTGAIGGVAVKYLAREDAAVVGLIGAGLQAQTQLLSVASVRRLKLVKVFARRPEHRDTFARQMSDKLGLEVRAVSDANEAVTDADIVVLATGSKQPVFETTRLATGVHVTSIGAKFQDEHELPSAVANSASVIVTDSIAQIESFGRPMVYDASPAAKRIVELSDIVAGTSIGRRAQSDVTLFASIGLAGTEVVLARELLNRIGGGATV